MKTIPASSKVRRSPPHALIFRHDGAPAIRPQFSSLNRCLVIGLVAMLLATQGQAAKVTINELSVNDVDASSIGAVSVSQFIEIGSLHTTATAPTIFSSYRFCRWSLDGEPGNGFRDPWGRSLNPVSFSVSVADTARAHYLPSSLDSDVDGLPDWYEMEFFGELSRDAANDADADGVDLQAEYSAGSSPLYANAALSGGVAVQDSAMITCNLAGYPSYVLRSVPAGTVNQTGTVAPGTVVSVPDLAGNASFAYWRLDWPRQEDAWGRALTSFSFTMGNSDREAVAYLVSGDGDGDGVPDAYELRYFASLDQDAAYDSDGDGIGLLAEYSGGTSPLYADVSMEGGVAWTDSALVTCNLAGYASYVVRSDPAGTVSQAGTVPPGTVVTVPDLSGNASFAYWTLDGVRQEDAWARSYSVFTFTVGSTDREAVAYLLSGDGDGDGVPDAYEQRFYGSLDHDGASDSDGDGISLLTEYTNGSNPLHANDSLEGGVAWVDSALVTTDLQAEIGVEQPIGTDLTEGDSCDFSSVQVGSSASLTFTVVNHGGIDLTDLALSIDGSDAGDFSVTTEPVSPVSHNDSTTFTIQFAPGSVGAKSAALHLASNDPNENPFDLVLSGTGTPTSQTIQFDPLEDCEVGDSPFTLAATASSGLTVTYTSSNPSVASVSGTTVTIVGAGTTTITASQGGNSNCLAATPVARTLIVTTTAPSLLLTDEFTGVAGALPDNTKFTWGGDIGQSGVGQLYLNTLTANQTWLRSIASATPGAGQTLILKMRVYAYAEEHWNPGIYGDGQPRGLRVGADANECAEFHSVSRTTVGVRVRHAGNESTATFSLPAGVDSMHDYEIHFNPTAAVFMIDGVTAATMTTNLPTGLLNLYVATYYGGSGQVPVRMENVSMTLYQAPSFVVWEAGCFSAGELGDSAVSGSNADPDHDGLSNLMEYALGLAPRSFDRTGHPEISTDGTSLHFTFTRPASRVGINYSVKTSTDLVNWSADGVNFYRVGSVDQLETWRATSPISSSSRLFFHLNVTRE